MEQVDRRIRRTKKLLENSLIALTLEKEYDAITIQEITDHADIGYRTFFRHYSDKDALLKDVLETMVMELRAILAPPPPEVFTDPNANIGDLTNSAALFRHVQKHSDLYRVLLRSERSLIESVMAFATQEIKGNISGLIEPDIPVEIIANHMVSATIALIRWWLDTDMVESVESMSEYSLRLIAQPAHELMLSSLKK